MTVGRAVAERVLRDLTSGGLSLSLHAGDPGDDGAAEIPGAGRLLLSAAHVAIRDRAVVVAAEPPALELGVAGLVTHAGLWTANGRFIAGGRLDVPLPVAVGVAVTAQAGTTLLAWAEAR